MKQYHNELTEYLDKYANISEEAIKGFGGWYYMFYSKRELAAELEESESEDELRYIAIRYPGCTIGHIGIDKDDIVKEVKFYDCGKCNSLYDDEALLTTLTDKYVGKPYDFRNDKTK